MSIAQGSRILAESGRFNGLRRQILEFKTVETVGTGGAKS